MKLLLKIFLMLTAISWLCPLTMAQSGFTNVTAVVADSNGTKYVNSPYVVTFYDPGTSGRLPLLSGSTFQQSYNGYATDSSGNLSITLPDNAVIASTSGATNTQWTFSICTAVGAYTTVYCIPSTRITITGGSQNISSILTPIAPILPPVASAPGNPLQSIQFNCTGGFCGAPGIKTPDGNSLSIKGQNPYSDVTAFGARTFAAGNAPAGSWAGTNGTTTVTLTTLKGGFNFVNGDGIEIDGAGPKNTLTTPVAPTVTPATAAAPTGTEWYANIPAAGVGASTYSYMVIARDRFGGLTAVSPTTTITTGQATLGLTTATIATITRSNDTLTVVTTGNTLVNAGSPTNASTMVHVVAGTGRDAISGYYLACSRTNATTFTLCTTPVDTRAQGWTAGDTYQQTTGTVSYFVSNHIHITAVANAWEYYICGQRPGDVSPKLIGQTKPQGAVNGYVDLDFDDYGSPFMDNQTFPRYVTNAACISAVATNDMYSGTVISGGGTTSLIVSPVTSQTVAAAFISVDAEPGMLAAMKFSNFNTNGFSGFGYTLIPGIGPGPNNGYAYKLVYPLIVPAKTGVTENADIISLETITLMGNVTWTGIMNPNLGTPQFGFNAYSTVQSITGEPVISTQAVGNLLDHVDILNNTPNGGVAVITDNGFGFGANYVNFRSNANSTDYLSMGLIVRNTSQTTSFVNLYTTYFNGGPNQVADASWTPLLWMPPGQNGSGGYGGNVIEINSYRASFNRRGFVFNANGGSNGPYHLDFNYTYRQGGIAPDFAFQNSSANTQISIHNTSQDTEGNPLIACLNISGACGSFDLSMNDLSANNSIFSGTRPNYFHITNLGSAPGANHYALPNRNGCQEGSQTGVFAPYDTTLTFISGTSSLFTCFSPMHMPGGQSFFFDISQPTTVVATAAGGGSIPVGTYYYCVSPVGFDQGEGICSQPSATVTTTGGTQTVNGTFTGSLGAVTYNIYRCNTSNACLVDGSINTGVGWTRVILHQTGVSFTDTFATGNNLGPPMVSGTGASLSSGNYYVAPLFASP